MQGGKGAGGLGLVGFRRVLHLLRKFNGIVPSLRPVSCLWRPLDRQTTFLLLATAASLFLQPLLSLWQPVTSAASLVLATFIICFP